MSKENVISIGSDPRNITSYGLLMDKLMKHTSERFDWHYVAFEKKFGEPEDRDYYTCWKAGETEHKFFETHLKKMMKKLDPAFFFTVGDCQHFHGWRYYFGDVPWVHWLPIDNIDVSQITHHKGVFEDWDLIVPMSKFAENFLIQKIGKKVTNAVYPYLSETYKPFRSEEEFKELEEFKKKIALGDRKLLLYVGRIGWRKNVEFLLGVQRILVEERDRNDIVLYLHSDINDPAKEFNVYKALHMLDLNGNKVYGTPFQEFDEGATEEFLNLLYNLATIFVSAHAGEGFGLPFAEAFMTKTPILGTNFTTIPELVGKGQRGIPINIKTWRKQRGANRPYVDLHDFADKIEYLIDNPGKRKKMGESAYKWAKEVFNPQRLTEEWYNIFDKITIKRVDATL